MSTGRNVKRPPEPTPEEIALRAAEIRAGWDEKKWELQRTARERHWLPLNVQDPVLD